MYNVHDLPPAEVYAAIIKRLQRREDYQNDLENAEYEKKTAVFWGFSTEGEDHRIKEIKQKGYGSRMERWKFAALNWSMAIIGSLIPLVAWADREPTEPWKSEITNLISIAILIGSYAYYQFLRTIRKLERRMNWFEQTLRAVNKHAEKSVSALSQRPLKSGYDRA